MLALGNPGSNSSKLMSFRIKGSGRWALLAVLVGLLAGLSCIVLEFLIHAVGELVREFAGFEGGGAAAESRLFGAFGDCFATDAFSPLLLVAVMTIGGAISGWIVFRFAPEAAGAGTDASVDAFHQQKGINRG